MRLGLQRDLRKIRRDFRRATPRSTGARAAARARLRVLSVGVSSWSALDAGGEPWAGALVGEIGHDRNALALADADDPVGACGSQVVSAARQSGREP